MDIIVRIKRNLWFKPRRCPDCDKLCWFCHHYCSERCPGCHKRHRHHVKRVNRCLRYGHYKNEKYRHGWQNTRKKVIKAHPYCSLCGATINLTVHHVGGGCTHYTVLCDGCHQAYERWNMKRKDNEWKKKMKTGGLSFWKSIMQIVQYHYLISCYRIRLLLAIGHQEALLDVSNLVEKNTTE